MNAYPIHVQSLSIGLLVARLVVGLVMAVHGSQKLLGWFGGYGLTKTGELFVHLGFRPGRTFAALASLAEVASGLLIALGFLGPIGPALMVSVMIVAIIAVHWEHGLLATTNGIELPLLYLAAAVVFALTGYGLYSLDAWIGLANRWPPTITWLALGVGAAGGLANAAMRRRATPERV